MTQTKNCTQELFAKLVCRFREGSPFSFPDNLANEILPYIYIYIFIYNIYIYIYLFIYLLGSSARIARAETYGIILQDYITGLYDGILPYNITG